MSRPPRPLRRPRRPRRPRQPGRPAGRAGRWLVALLLASCGGGSSAPSAPAPQPNVLFVVVDDLNDWIGALGGHPQASTPNLDRLAERSLLFTNAHCSAPLCNPSRVSVLTGLSPTTTGVHDNARGLRQALPHAVTLPQHFARGGYDVWGAGKVFHEPDVGSWDAFFPQPADPRPGGGVAHGVAGAGELEWGPLDVQDEDMGDSRVVDWAVARLLAQRGRRPFFLACGLFRPHLPFYVPREHFERFPLDAVALPAVPADDLDDVPPAGVLLAERGGVHASILAQGEWSRAVQGYLASIRFADAQVGRLLDALEDSGHADDTLVVLWSDNGWHLGEKNHWQKVTAWEEATRVPLLIAVPEGLFPRSPTPPSAAGRRCAEPVSLLDLFPTLLDLCGLPQSDRLEGQSLLPQLADPDAPRERPAVTTLGPGLHAVRSRDFRYVRYPDGGEELYDHRVDPEEWTNLAGDPTWAEVRAELARWLPD